LPAALDARLDLDLDELMWTGSEVERLPSEQIDDRLRRRGRRRPKPVGAILGWFSI